MTILLSPKRKPIVCFVGFYLFQETSALSIAMETAQQQLCETKAELNSLTAHLEEERTKSSKIHRNEMQMKQKLKCLQEENKRMCGTLESQCAENVKLSSQLCRAQEQMKTLQAENSFVKTKFEGLQQKHKHSQDEVLALRGRLTTSQKSQEKLQVKCSALEKSASSPTVLKVSTRSKEEQKLAAECRRKDELLASYVKEVSVVHQDQQRLQEEVCNLQQRLRAEEQARDVLSTALEVRETSFTARILWGCF